MERTMSSKAGLGSRKRHTAAEMEHKFERRTMAPANVAGSDVDLFAWAAAQRGVNA